MRSEIDSFFSCAAAERPPPSAPRALREEAGASPVIAETPAEFVWTNWIAPH